jgi:hypothetical protein
MEANIQLFKTVEGQAQYLAAYDAAMKLWPVEYSSNYVPTSYGKTHVIACGPISAFPLVLLHGGYANSTMWFSNIVDLSAHFRVYAIDTVGEPGKACPLKPMPAVNPLPVGYNRFLKRWGFVRRMLQACPGVVG